MELSDLSELSRPDGGRVVLLVLDGLGGLPMEPGGLTELEAARTPYMDGLLARGGCGLHEPVAAGVTPGSGPGHLALFGYDPLRYRIGRGVLEALGVGFPLEPEDVAVRGNFCTLDPEGRVSDRRAGRISTETGESLSRLLDGIRVEGAEVRVRAVKEHRFLMVLRFPEPVAADVEDTDPGRPGEPPGEARAREPDAEPTARAVRAWLEEARERLADREEADMVLLRGFSRLPDWPSFPDVFGMRALAAAAYPVYRGVARLVGMEAREVSDGPGHLADALQRDWEGHDFFFLHLKGPDRAGEDGDFDAKVALIEEADEAVPDLLAPMDLARDVIVVTGDHSTPARLRSHSWHPVPFLMAGGAGRPEGGGEFSETRCAAGVLGSRRGCELMPLAAARAGRLEKFGA